ncbi:uncharacterized protein LOC119112310 [Pollicipes pollicipes]|uniref:uncharacterized protein LOC119112310 n=1 Tax=Pollicipes pollicipes TaxID=41117 RepID=UPI001884AD97|nr:uncharacterized protein LOC119112310 [Pollicipes pollicipes]
MAVRWARRRLWTGGALLTALVTWLGWQPTHTVTFTHSVAVSPRRLWEHVADFNNIAALSPLITEFDLGEESGSYQDWRYTVTYREKMATLPLVGHATSTFRVRPVGDRFEIEGQSPLLLHDAALLARHKRDGVLCGRTRRAGNAPDGAHHVRVPAGPGRPLRARDRDGPAQVHARPAGVARGVATAATTSPHGRGDAGHSPCPSCLPVWLCP